MKKIGGILIALFSLTSAFGQHTEFDLSLNSGLFSFSGKSAESTTFIDAGSPPSSSYTNNPYGSKTGLCYGISGNLKKVTPGNLVFGVDLGYEVLRSLVSVNAVSLGSTAYAASGKSYLNTRFVNPYPYIGYRFTTRELSWDLVGGFDLGYCLSATEDGNATAANGTEYKTSRDVKTISMDVRPRVQLSLQYHKTGVYIGYAYGLTNYTADYVGGSNGCYARLLRFGLTYRLFRS